MSPGRSGIPKSSLSVTGGTGLVGCMLHRLVQEHEIDALREGDPPIHVK